MCLTSFRLINLRGRCGIQTGGLISPETRKRLAPREPRHSGSRRPRPPHTSPQTPAQLAAGPTGGGLEAKAGSGRPRLQAPPSASLPLLLGFLLLLFAYGPPSFWLAWQRGGSLARAAAAVAVAAGGASLEAARSRSEQAPRVRLGKEGKPPSPKTGDCAGSGTSAATVAAPPQHGRRSPFPAGRQPRLEPGVQPTDGQRRQEPVAAHAIVVVVLFDFSAANPPPPAPDAACLPEAAAPSAPADGSRQPARALLQEGHPHQAHLLPLLHRLHLGVGRLPLRR